MFCEHLFAPWFEAEGIVPAFRMEGISKHGAAENEKYLAFGHTQLELFDLAWIQRIALLNVYFIDAAGHYQRAKKG